MSIKTAIMKKAFPSITEEENKELARLSNRQNHYSLLWEQSSGQAKGVAYQFQPFLEELYKDDPEELHEAYERQLAYYNVNPNLGGFISGLVYSMEKERAKDRNAVSGEAISNIRVALCGPLAGIGDSIFQGVFKIIFAGLTMGMAAQGSILGPILFVLLFGLVQIGTIDYTTYLGYTTGTKAIDKLFGDGLMESITKAASILGLFMVGAMSASLISFGFNWVIELGGTSLDVQATLDSIFPGLMALVLTFGVSKLLKKKVNVALLVFGIIGICLIFALLGII